MPPPAAIGRYNVPMHWIVLLGIAVVLVAVAAVAGIKPSGGRPVARTRLMTAARAVPVILAVILVVAAITAR
jgi:hypothetical protein